MRHRMAKHVGRKFRNLVIIPYGPSQLARILCFCSAAAGILYALSAATAFLIIWNLITFMEEGDRRVAFAVLCAMTCLVTGAVLLTRNLRIRNSHPLHSVMALQVCYVSHVVFCIISFVYPGLFGFPHLSLAGWGAGGYLSVATIALYAAQVWTATQSS